MDNKILATKLVERAHEYDESHHRFQAYMRASYSVENYPVPIRLDNVGHLHIPYVGDFMQNEIFDILENEDKEVIPLEQRIRTDISFVMNSSYEFMDLYGLHKAYKIAPFVESLNKSLKGTICGSMRRQLVSVHDFDIITSKSYEKVCETINSFDNITIIGNGTKRIRVSMEYPIETGDSKIIEGDIRIIPKESLGTALLHFTGPQEFNIKLRTIAKSRGMKINEYEIKSYTGRTHKFSEESKVLKFIDKYLIPHFYELYKDPKERT